jgi:hypothetical protein
MTVASSRFLRQSLKRLSIATTEAAKALELATSAAFDLAILDYDLPT